MNHDDGSPKKKKSGSQNRKLKKLREQDWQKLSLAERKLLVREYEELGRSATRTGLSGSCSTTC
jgi:hypothetical protein